MGDNRQADHHMNIPDTDLSGADSTPPGRGYADGIRDAVPVIMGYLAIGLAFGVVAKTAGITVIEVAVMSMILYAGSAQFVMVGLIAAGVPASAVIVTIFWSIVPSPVQRRRLALCRHEAVAERPDRRRAHRRDIRRCIEPARREAVPGRMVSGHQQRVPRHMDREHHHRRCSGQCITDIRALGFDFALAAMLRRF